IHESNSRLRARIVLIGERTPKPHGGGEITTVEGRQSAAEILLSGARGCRRNRKHAPSCDNSRITRKSCHRPDFSEIDQQGQDNASTAIASPIMPTSAF